MKKYFLYIVIAAFAVACKPEIDEFLPSKGDADFSRFVSVGNSITSGYMDGALYKAGQQYAFPNILAKQFKLVGGGEFIQPVVNSEYGIMPGKFKLGIKTDCAGVAGLSPIPDQGAFDVSSVTYKVNNLGVYGAKSFHLLIPGYGSLNPYYGRFASNPANSIISEVPAINPTFFTLWIGNNDVLSYAVQGGAADSITNPLSFQGYMTSIVASLKANGAKGAIATIPDITSIPFFTTIPYNALVLKEISQVNALNAAYHPFNSLLLSLGITDTIAFKLGPNPFIIEDPSLPLPAPYKFRQIKSTELITLTVPRDSLSCAYWGSQKPIPHRYVLDNTEVNKIKTAVSAYNLTISNLATTNGLALVDINKYFNDARNGVYFDGIKFSSSFITGGLFSLDGVHPSARGQAIVTNYFLKAINEKFNAQIPFVNINDYPGLKFP